MGAWIAGGLLGVVGLSKDANAAQQVQIMASAGVLAIEAVVLRMAARDPSWLDLGLGVSAARVASARFVVALLYAQGVVIPAVIGLWMRHGSEALSVMLHVEALAIVGAGLATLAAMEWRGRGIWAYGPLGIMVWAVGLAGQG